MLMYAWTSNTVLNGSFTIESRILRRARNLLIMRILRASNPAARDVGDSTSKMPLASAAALGQKSLHVFGSKKYHPKNSLQEIAGGRF